MAEHNGSWRKMGDHGGTKQNMPKHDKTCCAENGGTWCNMAAEMKISQAMQARLS